MSRKSFQAYVNVHDADSKPLPTMTKLHTPTTFPEPSASRKNRLFLLVLRSTLRLGRTPGLLRPVLALLAC